MGRSLGAFFAGIVLVLSSWWGRPHKQPEPETFYERQLLRGAQTVFWIGVIGIAIGVLIVINHLWW